MMGAREFELMKQGSYFIAMSRGKIYDHAALVKALDSKRLAGGFVNAARSRRIYRESRLEAVRVFKEADPVTANIAAFSR